jgi:Putative zinc-finger
MSCQTVQNSISGFLDHVLGVEEHKRVARHVVRCRECAAYLEELSNLRGELRSLPAVPVPQRLQTQLLVAASHERARWNATSTLPRAMRTWARGFQLRVDNLMRPFAIPFAGGVISALILFLTLLPTLGFRPNNAHNDVPIGFYTAASLIEVPQFGIDNDEAVVELYIDNKGQATDYSVERGRVTPEMQADLTKMMFFSRFTPATWFGQPTNGKVLVSFRRIHYVVRG